MAKKWEYKVLTDYDFSEESLNKLGEEGWELVAIAATAGYYDDGSGPVDFDEKYVLKREKI